ncbi:TauD/TfdA family dioxygenase [Marinomonas sp. GJ51-6]|uniref:TauD/TfdA family dioxygenase n=1 Tax=Marinomonas sp. GJ51-6 TaxID=2992802 RepID=UPI0029352B2A|nr:TauD/TfdA family dioxygenase [Marinomonas sp. GJ51-6]WOD06186.1 TauD/TfdA family dioxygenase [Marinomonas sp. GJ51-6]
MTLNSKHFINARDVKCDEELAGLVQKSLQEYKYVIVRSLDIDVKGIQESVDRFVQLASKVGTLENHTQNNSLVWHVKNQPLSNSKVSTFSEHSDEAILHTDTQYRDNPEDYIALCMLKGADCGGGQTYLLPLDEIYEELYSLPDGEAILATLRHDSYPFIVPSVFKKNGQGGDEFTYGSILNEDTIRFRVDTLEKGIYVHKELISQNAIAAFNVLKSIVTTSKKIKRVSLTPGDILFLDNKRCLHGRSAFKDNARHLLRLRMNRFA